MFHTASNIIAAVRQIDLPNRKSILNVVELIVLEGRCFAALNGVFRHQVFNCSELEVCLSAALFFRVSNSNLNAVQVKTLPVASNLGNWKSFGPFSVV